MGEKWNWSYVWDFLPTLAHGLLITFELTVLASIVAFILGLILTLIRMAKIPVVSFVVWLFVEFVRSTPLLVQVYFVFFVFPTAFGLKLSSMVTGVVTLGIHYATYTSDTYRAGIEAVPRGQWEAATALSLPRSRIWISVVLPQAIRRILPALGNYVISMFKDTPILLTVGLLELVGEAKIVGASNFHYAEPYTIAGIFFLVLSYPSSILVRRLEHRVRQR